MIAVDTSVWIAARRQPVVAEALDQLIDADLAAVPLPVRLELLSGVSKQHRRAFCVAQSALPLLVPTEDTWMPLAGWVEHAADAGETFVLADLLIASLAAEIGGMVWSLDQDFTRMSRLGFVQLYHLPH
jgi:predicted nucleic acid-binding protein